MNFKQMEISWDLWNKGDVQGALTYLQQPFETESDQILSHTKKCLSSLVFVTTGLGYLGSLIRNSLRISELATNFSVKREYLGLLIWNVDNRMKPWFRYTSLLNPSHFIPSREYYPMVGIQQKLNIPNTCQYWGCLTSL